MKTPLPRYWLEDRYPGEENWCGQVNTKDYHVNDAVRRFNRMRADPDRQRDGHMVRWNPELFKDLSRG